MTERFIPIVDARSMPVRPGAFKHSSTTEAALALPHPEGLLDRLQRPLRDLRISVTDRCNFRCRYCMPKEVFDQNHRYLPQQALLTFEEITRLASLFVALGVRKIRLTGGEPLLRKNIEHLIAMLSQLRTPEGDALDLTLTTNGSLLQRKAHALKAAGLRRVTVSLDALDDDIFRQMNDVDFPVRDVLAGLDAAQNAGLSDIKVNMVVKRGVNDHQVEPMTRHFMGQGMSLRFIEYMDVGSTNGWRMDDVVPSDTLLARLQSRFALVPLPAQQPGETAQRWGHADAHGQHDRSAGEIGFISSVTHAFCRDCNRARLSTEGQLYLCLFASQGHDLRQLLRGGASDAEIRQALGGLWQQRTDRYSEWRASAASTTSASASAEGLAHPARPRVEMSYIGG